MPMAPAPMTMTLFGCFSMVMASLLPMTVVPLKGKPGMGRLFAPVAMRMFAASWVSFVPLAAVTSTLPSAGMPAVPLR